MQLLMSSRADRFFYSEQKEYDNILLLFNRLILEEKL